MPSCREVDPLFTPYIDGEATAAERAIVDAHLRACPKCRHQTALQAAARESVRSKLCPPRAPEHLRARCRAAAHAGPFGLPRTFVSVSIAAALALVVGGVLVYSLTGVSTVLAAQLTLDHVTCFAVHDSSASVDPGASEDRYARRIRAAGSAAPRRCGRFAAGWHAPMLLWRRRGGTRDVPTERRTGVAIHHSQHRPIPSLGRCVRARCRHVVEAGYNVRSRQSRIARDARTTCRAV